MNKIIVKYVLIVLISNNVSVKAQDSIFARSENLRFIGIEASYDLFFSTPGEFDFIRGDVLPYSSGAVSESIRGHLFKKSIGIKTELRNRTNRLGLLFGLTYSRINASLGKEDLFNSTSEYFYLLDNQSGTTTEYFRINEINRSIDYIGIPIELRYLSKANKGVKLYFKAALKLDYKINTSSQVIFHNDQMSSYQDIVLTKFDEAGLFFSTIAFSTGINLGKKPNIDLELILPYVLLSPEMSGLLTSHAGMGFKIGISMPY
jgi:hypothetical protein